MCLGIPGQVVSGDAGHPDLALVAIDGAPRPINMAILERRPVAGEWVLVHMGFAMEPLSADAAAEARAMLRPDQQFVDDLLDGDGRIRPAG